MPWGNEACKPQPRKPTPWKPVLWNRRSPSTPQTKVVPAHCNQRKPLRSNKGPVKPKINKKGWRLEEHEVRKLRFQSWHSNQLPVWPVTCLLRHLHSTTCRPPGEGWGLNEKTAPFSCPRKRATQRLDLRLYLKIQSSPQERTWYREGVLFNTYWTQSILWELYYTLYFFIPCTFFGI